MPEPGPVEQGCGHGPGFLVTASAVWLTRQHVRRRVAGRQVLHAASCVALSSAQDPCEVQHPSSSHMLPSATLHCTALQARWRWARSPSITCSATQTPLDA